MNRFIFLTAWFFLCTGTASADYVLIKINMNQMNFLPPLSPNQGGAAGQAGQAGGNPGGMAGGKPSPMMGGGRPMPGMAGAMGGIQPKDPNAPPEPKTVPDDPNAKWVSAYVEIKNRAAKMVISNDFWIFPYVDKWGHNNLFVQSHLMPMFPDGGYVEHDTFDKEFKRRMTKEKDKSIKYLLHQARWTLSRGHFKEFHDVMKEAEKVEPKHPNVRNYLSVKKALASPFKNDDPAQAGLVADLGKNGYKAFTSLPGHYRIYAKIEDSDKFNEAIVKRRLGMLEESLENFYQWFAVQDEPELQKRLPRMPKYVLNAIVTVGDEEFAEGRGEFREKHKQWGQPPITGDGFTPRRDNVIVMSSRSRLHDPVFAEYEKVLKAKIQEANQHFAQMQMKTTITRENLLNGNLTSKEKHPEVYKMPMCMIIVGAAQTGVLLAKTLEDEAERYTISHASIRQLLVASEMFPRNVQIPEWTVEGLAAFFETPPGALYPTIGAASWTHLVSFKHFDKRKRFLSSEATLQNVITDAYFVDARHLSKIAHERRDEADAATAQHAAAEAWELARCTSWAFVYYLSVGEKLHYLFNFGDELDKLPRDLDLKEFVLQASFAKAFNMTSTRDARQVDAGKLKEHADKLFKMMKEVNLEMVAIQAKYEQNRAKMDDAGKTPAPVQPSPMPNPKPGPQGSLSAPNSGSIPEARSGSSIVSVIHSPDVSADRANRISLLATRWMKMETH